MNCGGKVQSCDKRVTNRPIFHNSVTPMLQQQAMRVFGLGVLHIGVLRISVTSLYQNALIR